MTNFTDNRSNHDFHTTENPVNETVRQTKEHFLEEVSQRDGFGDDSRRGAPCCRGGDGYGHHPLRGPQRAVHLCENVLPLGDPLDLLQPDFRPLVDHVHWGQGPRERGADLGTRCRATSNPVAILW